MSDAKELEAFKFEAKHISERLELVNRKIGFEEGRILATNEKAIAELDNVIWDLMKTASNNLDEKICEDTNDEAGLCSACYQKELIKVIEKRLRELKETK